MAETVRLPVVRLDHFSARETASIAVGCIKRLHGLPTSRCFAIAANCPENQLMTIMTIMTIMMAGLPRTFRFYGWAE